MVKAEGFGRFQVLFDAPARADGSHHGGQRGLGWRPDQVVGQLVWVVQAAAHHEPMATVCDPSMHDGQTSPVKEARAFGPQALGETLPLPRAEGLLGNASHIREQEACPCLHTDHLDGRDGQGVSQVLVLQEGAQVGTVPVDGIGDHPADGQAGSLGTLDHLVAQFGFGRKADRLRNMSGLPPGWIGAPVFRQI